MGYSFRVFVLVSGLLFSTASSAQGMEMFNKVKLPEEGSSKIVVEERAKPVAEAVKPVAKQGEELIAAPAGDGEGIVLHMNRSPNPKTMRFGVGTHIIIIDGGLEVILPGGGVLFVPHKEAVDGNFKFIQPWIFDVASVKVETDAEGAYDLRVKDGGTLGINSPNLREELAAGSELEDPDHASGDETERRRKCRNVCTHRECVEWAGGGVGECLRSRCVRMMRSCEESGPVR